MDENNGHKKKRLIEGFFEESLSEEEKKEFLDIVASNKEFLGDFMTKLDQETKRRGYYDEVNLPTEESRKNQSTRKRRITLTLLAAVFILTISILKVTVFPSYQQLFNRNYEPLEAAGYVTRGQSQLPHSNFITGVRYYGEGDYLDSWRSLNTLLNDSSATQPVFLFAGLSLMGMEDYEHAIEIFESIHLSNDQITPEIDWYLGLCYIATGKAEKAITILSRVSDQPGSLGKKASKMLKKLNR